MNNATELKQNAISVKSGSARSVMEITLLATAVAGLWYFGFFWLAPKIWSQNLQFKPEDITAFSIADG